MTTETNQGYVLPPDEDFDATAKKGWNFFTKFLLGNVVVTVIVLLIVGLLTVWS